MIFVFFNKVVYKKQYIEDFTENSIIIHFYHFLSSKGIE